MNINQAKASAKESTTHRRRSVWSALDLSALRIVVFIGWMIACLGLLNPSRVAAQSEATPLISGPDEIVLQDDFDNGDVLSPGWTLSFDNSNGWTASESTGALVVNDVDDSVDNDGVWGSATLHQSFMQSIVGDFSASLDISWDQNDSRAMETMSLRLLDANGNLLAEIGFYDAWVGDRGRKYAALAGTGTYQSGSNDLSLVGSSQLLIKRQDDFVEILWGEITLLSGYNDSDVSAIELKFKHYKYNPSSSYFSTISIDDLLITGEVLLDEEADASNDDPPVFSGTIEVTSPNDGLITNQAEQTITGNISRSGTLTINNDPVTVEADLTFSHPVTLVEGENTFILDLDNGIDTQILTLTYDPNYISTLRVVDSVPSNGVLLTNHSSVFELSFSEVIDPDTFASDDVTITGPNGTIEIASVSSTDNQTFTVNFLSAIIENGEYTVAIGPNVLTPGGGMMNQDDDAIAGEDEEDVFRSSFTVEKIIENVQTHTGTISAHTTWSADTIHRVSGNVTVNAGIILTIEPGAIIKFNQSSQLNIYGILDADGTQNDKIVFTSYRDDNVGGNTNGGSADESGAPGDWYYLRFHDSVTESLTKFNHVVIRYAGQGNNNALYIDRADIEVVNSEISNNAYRGIYTYDSSALIQDSVIRDNGHEGVRVDYNSVSLLNNQILDNVHSGIHSYRGIPTINGNVISGNSWGIYHNNYQAAPVIQGNTITGNDNTARLPVNSLPLSADGNILGPNKRNGIRVIGSTLNKDLHLEVFDLGDGKELNTYQIESNISVANGTALTVDPGVIVKFNPNVYLDVYGTISAVGTATNPVVFTSLYDDSYGGDFNLDATPLTWAR